MLSVEEVKSLNRTIFTYLNIWYNYEILQNRLRYVLLDDEFRYIFYCILSFCPLPFNSKVPRHIKFKEL